MSTLRLQSLQLLVKCISASVNMLFWSPERRLRKASHGRSFCLLTFFQCVAGLIISTLCRDFIDDPNQDRETRENVFKRLEPFKEPLGPLRYFGTFTRTFLTMFEILFANFVPSCRILVESVSEWFSVFFLIYRCVLGFAAPWCCKSIA